jgi:pimeloyl-ACP methyl ester carboxylesterase
VLQYRVEDLEIVPVELFRHGFVSIGGSRAESSQVLARGSGRPPGGHRRPGPLGHVGYDPLMVDALEPLPLPDGIRSRYVDNGNGLNVHVLEAGADEPSRPLLLLLHGFPELAYSWRRIMPALAEEGFRVVAPDQRGYGRSTGWDPNYDGDVGSFRLSNLVIDALGLVAALGHREVAAVVGHDFGSPVAAVCALSRPDVFRKAVLMSAPWGGVPDLPFGAASAAGTPGDAGALLPMQALAGLAQLDPPRKHYVAYFATRAANDDLLNAPQGLTQFLHDYLLLKAAEGAYDMPRPLRGWSAAELARLPPYYVMEAALDMPATVAACMDNRPTNDRCRWLSGEELAVYAGEFWRTGFQGGLNWYRCAIDARFNGGLRIFAGRTIDVPVLFVAGRLDWGTYQRPGEYERMQSVACSRFNGVHLVPDAGHWIQQEKPEELGRLLLEFLRS